MNKKKPDHPKEVLDDGQTPFYYKKKGSPNITKRGYMMDRLPLLFPKDYTVKVYLNRRVQSRKA